MQKTLTDSELLKSSRYIRKKMLETGLTYREMAKQLNVSFSYLWHIANGIKPISLKIAESLIIDFPDLEIDLYKLRPDLNKKDRQHGNIFKRNL